MSEKQVRYYYDDPLAAAWMSKHFGMIFSDVKGHHIKIRDNHDGFVAGGRFPKRAFIRPDSLHILEPQIGDIGILTYAEELIAACYETYCTETGWWWGDDQCDKAEDGCTVWRKGLAFHRPKQEQPAPPQAT